MNQIKPKSTFDLRPAFRTRTKSTINGWTQQDYFDEYLKIKMKTSTLSASLRKKVADYVERIKSQNK